MAKKSTENLPAKIPDMTVKQAQESFNEHEAKIFREIFTMVHQKNKETLQWYWDLGVRLIAIRDDAKKNKQHYGKGVIDRISRGCGYSTSGQLYQAMRVAEAFGTKKAFMEYVKLAGESKNTLSWGHMVYLAGVSDPAMRLELAAAALEQTWSVDMLAKQVQQLIERKPRGLRKGKPKAQVPTNVKKCLHTLHSKADDFIHQVNSAWTGDAFNIVSKIEDMPTGAVNDKLLDEITDARAKLVALIDGAQRMEAELTNADRAIRRKMAAQEAAADAVVDEEEEPAEEFVEDSDDDDPVVMMEADEDEETAEEEEAEEEAEETKDEVVNVGEMRNAAAREKRALERVRSRMRQLHTR